MIKSENKYEGLDAQAIKIDSDVFSSNSLAEEQIQVAKIGNKYCFSNILKIAFVIFVVLFILFFFELIPTTKLKTIRKSQNKNMQVLKKLAQNTNFQLEKLGKAEDYRLDYEHKSDVLTLPYPALGMPIPGKQFNFTEITHAQYADWEKQAGDLLIRPYNDTDCIMKRYGGALDGGYLVCENIMDKVQGLINFGIQGRDTFGCALTTTYNMPNFMYDCTSSIVPTCRTNHKNNRYYQLCLSDRTERSQKYDFISLKDIIDINGLKDKKIMIKIDIQGSQWPAFRSLPQSYLQNIVMIIMEMHTAQNQNAAHSKDYRFNRFWGNLDTIRTLSKHFINTQFHANNYACFKRQNMPDQHFWTAFANQITLVNRKYVKINKPTRSYKAHPLSALSSSRIPDCQMGDDGVVPPSK